MVGTGEPQQVVTIGELEDDELDGNELEDDELDGNELEELPQK